MPDGTEIQDAQPTTTPPTEARSQAGDDELLREAGRSALQAERKARSDAEKQAKALQAEIDRLREATASEADKALLAAKREERDRVLAEVKADRDEAEARVRAARLETAVVRRAINRFHDLDDVLGELARDESVVMAEDGTFAGIDAALKALEKRKPHWVKAEPGQGAYGAPAAGRSLGTPGTSREQVIAQRRRELQETGRYSM